MTHDRAPGVCCLGEAVLDLVPTGDRDGALRPVLAGGAFTASVALARLGLTAAFGGCLSEDLWGDRMMTRLREEGVDTAFVRRVGGPSTLAVVSVAEDGQPTFSLYTADTAGVALEPADLVEPIRRGWVLHVGGVALAVDPSATTLHRAVVDAPEGIVTFVDPNVRPGVIQDMDRQRRRLMEMMGAATIVKASDADLDLLHPGIDPAHVARDLVAAGAGMVVVTRGERGALAVTRTANAAVDAPRVEVVDTVGAGDSFGAGVLAWLAEHDRLTVDGITALDASSLEACLGFAARVGALACTRVGANPPRRIELD